jgi:hypothetical protein
MSWGNLLIAAILASILSNAAFVIACDSHGSFHFDRMGIYITSMGERLAWSKEALAALQVTWSN